MERTLLLVDDEENILSSLTRLLRQDGYRLLTATSAAQALELLAGNEVGVIITDQRMPGMTGIELLRLVKADHPDTVRMVLSGYADIDAVTAAINQGEVYRFLNKPWEDAALRVTVRDAFRHYELEREKKRLAREIQLANDELSRLNLELRRLLDEKARQMAHIANYDALTNLPNRVLFTDRLQQALLHAQRQERLAALMVLDLDRFKIINDSLGHPAGDKMLVEIARRLAGCVRSIDTVARVGGDEFMFVLTDLADPQDAAVVAQDIFNVLAKPIELDGNEVFATASVGICVYPQDGADTTTLLKNADAALYHAKQQGRNNYQYYAEEMNAKAMERLKLETGLRHALERDEFVLYYQPQLSLDGGGIVGVEALLRWRRPEAGLLGPDLFVPLLEETGLIVPVGEWVLHTACAQNKAWQKAGFTNLRMSVNLSVLQLRQPDLIGMVERILAETGIEPALENLELELTESMIMHNADEIVATLSKLHDMGVQLSIDDFGTGYSSLSYLRRFPINTLKVDRSFVRDLVENPDDAAIVAAIIALGHSLKLNVIAEGVETAEQLAYLREMGCDEMQGFLFSPGLPADEVESLLKEGRTLGGN